MKKESALIALINFVVASILTVTSVILINGMLKNNFGFNLTILNIGVRQIALMLLVSLFVAYIASVIPVRKVAKKRPIDAIRDR